MKPILSGIFTVDDRMLYEYLRDLDESESIFIEPSACAAFSGPANIFKSPEGCEYIKQNIGEDDMNLIHIAWSTGGNLVPDAIRKEYLETRL